ncbi:hypothetical protein V1514DRAFT_50379 [Lipomyces japonicus]|uniref:uncharacterized protein n=1 Tax=Lipomyces japonicus TaxID=56871 RepID=UPI0034CDB239
MLICCLVLIVSRDRLSISNNSITNTTFLVLKRHQASIDLKRNVLVMGEEEVPFLGDADLPAQAIENELADPSNRSTDAANQAGHQPIPQASIKSQPSSQPIARPVSTPTTESSAIEFSEANISQLESLGVTREEAISALRQANGNVEIAASLLFQ